MSRGNLLGGGRACSKKWVSGGITRGIFGERVTTWQGKWEWTVARKGGVEEAAGEEGCRGSNVGKLGEKLVE